MKVLFDTITMITAFLDDAGNTTVVHPTEDTVQVKADGTAINPATGQPMTNVPGYVSDLANMITGKQGATTGQGGSIGPATVRETISLTDGLHFSQDEPADRTVTMLARPAGGGTVNVQGHIKATKAGKMRLQLDGNDVQGGVKFGYGDGGSDTVWDGAVGEGQLNATDYITKALQVGDIVTMSLRSDGGDPTFQFVCIPQ